MITHRTCVDVAAVSPRQLYESLARPTDQAYRRWWPGTHLRFHVLRRDSWTSPIGDVVRMDERVGARRLRFDAVVRVAEPAHRIVWQLRVGVLLPAWLDITLRATPQGTRVEHELRLGWTGLPGRLTDPLMRLYFSPAFADALTVHATTEFPLLTPGAQPPAVLRPLPHRRAWERAARATLAAGGVAPFLTDLELQYARVLAQRPSFVDESPVLTRHFEDSIAPMVAAYRVFAGRDDPDPLSRTDDLVEARWRQMAQLIGLSARLPVPWRLLAWLVESTTIRDYPAPGWTITWRERSGQRLAFDISTCIYHRTFAHYGVPQLTPTACRVDDILYARLPGATFARTGTLGRGDPLCDFSIDRTRPARRRHPSPSAASASAHRCSATVVTPGASPGSRGGSA
jgi:hypothetical protein